ncbi:CC_3452 family protein [Tsuneonella amylolytica]|uniref:CC_3452 family protein n=1 Tax=Tsuneonella amylolytica TaxID=2338327 RepID=UPI000EAA992B|nr:hypothetical protein [Tsuneonella amylolytica]
MPLSLRGGRPAAAVVALAWTALTIGTAIDPSPAYAAGSDGPYYRAELTAPVEKTRPIASGQVWTCTDTACVASRGTSRPAIVCARLAKEVGQISNFVADGKALAAEDLARCNR